MTRKKNKSGFPSIEQRAEQILDIISSEGFSSVAGLAAELGVSEMTIRRDLDRLEAENLIRRTHGGAIAEERTQIEIDFRERQKRRGAEKEAIGALASTLIKDGQRIFLDAGTTALAVVKHLREFRNLQVITSSLPVQMELLRPGKIDVILVGGQLLRSTMSLVGHVAAGNISSMRFDWAFLGTGGVDIYRGLTHSTLEEIPIKKAAAASAEKVAVLADHAKFGYNALALFMPIDEVDIIVTDKAIPDVQERLTSAGGRIKALWP